MTDTDSPLDSSPARTLGWAFFLGASWTWCIGMFFPVLLVREFGLWGWIVFAFPNVLGSAIAGAVLGSAQRSKKLLSQHTPAAIVFSIVTIAFHIFFVGWKLLGLVGLLPATAVFLLAAVFFAIGGGTRRDLVLAVIVILVSLVAMGIALTQPLGNGTLLTQADPSPGLLALTPVCMIGFFLCPYLDLTYHRARQSTAPAVGARAFQIGFAGPFLAMIVFTLLYARWMDGGGRNNLLCWVIGVHMIVQIAFTLSLHVRSVLVATAAQFKSLRVTLAIAAVAALALGAFAFYRPFLHWPNAGETVYSLIAHRTLSPTRLHETGEVIYLCFMGFYGALFPTYVLLCMIPTVAGPVAPSGARIGRVLVTSALMFCCYWLGLVEQLTWWLLVGVLILLVSRWRLPAKSPPGALT